MPRLNVSTTTMSHIFVIFFASVHYFDFRECFIFFHACLYEKKKTIENLPMLSHARVSIS